jgi:hypothetical protein
MFTHLRDRLWWLSIGAVIVCVLCHRQFLYNLSVRDTKLALACVCCCFCDPLNFSLKLYVPLVNCFCVIYAVFGFGRFSVCFLFDLVLYDFLSVNLFGFIV